MADNEGTRNLFIVIMARRAETEYLQKSSQHIPIQRSAWTPTSPAGYSIGYLSEISSLTVVTLNFPVAGMLGGQLKQNSWSYPDPRKGHDSGVMSRPLLQS
jgi:hypothetical protein